MKPSRGAMSVEVSKSVRRREPGAVVSWALYLGVLLVPMCSVYALLHAGVPDWAGLALSTLVVGSGILVLQRVWPYNDEWRGWRSVAGVDIAHMLFSTGLAVQAFHALVFGAVVSLSAVLTGWLGATLWPAEWPVPVQVGLALVVGDLGYYWVHRLGHEIPLFWRFHALHHSSEHYYVLASGRTHPVNAIAVYIAQVLPLVALGCPAEVLLMIAVFTSSNGLLQHANVKLQLGALSWVFASTDLHRWHHSTDAGESRHNYGSNLILWDVVFGTRYLPAHRGPARVGLPTMDYQRNFFRHLWSPFVYRKLEKRPEEAAVTPAG